MKVKKSTLPVGVNPRILAVCLTAAFAPLALPIASHAQSTWQGSNANGWNDAANWSPSIPGLNTGVFTSTDSALFNTNPANRVVTIDANRNIQSINFDTSAGVYTIGSATANAGNSLFLTSGGKIEILSTLTGTQSQTVNAPLVIAGANATYSFLNNRALTSVLTIAGNVSGGTAGNTILTVGGTNTAANTISGIISDGSAASLSLVKDGPAASALWVLQGNNTYTGTTTVNGGILRLRNSNALGATSGTTSISGVTSSIQLQNGINVFETLNMANANNSSGALQNTTNANTWSSTINVNTSAGNGATFGQNAGTTAGAEKFTVSGPVNLTGTGASLGLQGSSINNVGEISGIISGNGNISKASASTWILSGANDYTGTTSLTNGTLALGNNTALGNGGQFLITSSSTVQSSDSTTRTVSNPFGTFAGTNAVYSFGAQSGGQITGGTGNLVFSNTTAASLGTAARTFAVTNNTEFNGGITGSGSISKTLGGTLNLKGASMYSGGTTVSAGTLQVNNTTGSGTGTGALAVSAGAILGGNGIISGVTTISGSLRPGNSIDTLTVGNDVIWNASVGNSWVFELGTAASSLALANTTPGLSDLLNITGATSDFLKGTGSGWTFDFSAGGAVGWYKLVDWGTGLTDFVAGDFTASNLGSSLSGTFTVDAGTSALYLNVVPEPSTVALLTVGLTAMIGFRRRRA